MRSLRGVRDRLGEHVRRAGRERLGDAVNEAHDHAGWQRDERRHAEQRDDGGEDRKKPAVGEGPGGHVDAVFTHVLDGRGHHLLGAQRP